MTRHLRTALLCLAALSVCPVLAQTTAPTTDAATAPSTQPAVMEQTPPGFERVTVGQFSAFCQPVDEAWIKQTLAQVKPDKLPTTRPSDIVANIAAKRDDIIKGLAKDTGIDPTKISSMLDDELLPTLKKIDTLQPPVVFLVTTDSTMVSLIDNGWTNPRVSYNRLMKKMNYDDHISFSIDHPMDETMWFCIYDPADSPAERSKKLNDLAKRFESEVYFSEASRARVVTRSKFASFVEQQVFTPMKLSDNQTWLQLGVTTWLAAQYSSLATGEQPSQTLADLIFEPQNAYIKAGSLDLLSLPDLNAIRPEFRFSYINAARRKATLAIQLMVNAAGEDSIRKAIDAVKKAPPKDAQAMVSEIRSATAVNLQTALLPGNQ